MAPTALIIRHRTRPGRRDEVRAIWERHMAPAIAANPGHEAYFYCFDTADPDVICAFQQYSGPDAARVFLETPAYRDYQDEVERLLLGPPEVTSLEPVWIKPSR